MVPLFFDERIPSADQLSETFIFPYEIEFTETPSEDDAYAGNVIAIKGYMEIDLRTPTAENPVWNIDQWRDVRDRASAKFSGGNSVLFSQARHCLGKSHARALRVF